jgi:hypothetical protein
VIEVIRAAGKALERAGGALIRLAALVVTMLAVPWLTTLVTPFGIHRDEFLYWSLGRHLE